MSKDINITITWDHVYFKVFQDVIQGNSIQSNNGFLIWNNDEITFLSSLKNNFGNPLLNIFELNEITKLTEMFYSGKIIS